MHTKMTGICLHNVPKFDDLGGRRHPLVDHFPRPIPIYEVEFPLPAHTLTLVTAAAPKSQQFSTYVNQIYSSHLAPNFPLSLSIWARIFHSNTQARYQFWDTVRTTRKQQLNAIARNECRPLPGLP